MNAEHIRILDAILPRIPMNNSRNMERDADRFVMEVILSNPGIQHHQLLSRVAGNTTRSFTGSMIRLRRMNLVKVVGTFESESGSVGYLPNHRTITEALDRIPYDEFIPPYEETYSEDKMNTNALINSMYENLKAVQILFKGYGKAYTYKTFDEYKTGDKCIVESPGEGYMVVEVIGIDTSKLEENHKFKWVVQKVDDSAYLNQNENEKEMQSQLASLVARTRRKEAIDKVREMLGDQSTQLDGLIENLNKGTLIDHETIQPKHSAKRVD